MKIFLTIATNLIFILLVFFVLGYSIYLGASDESWITFFAALAIGTILWIFFYKIISKYVNNLGLGRIQRWISSLTNCTYKQGYEKTGIGLDIDNKTIYLAKVDRKTLIEKRYGFHDVRSWGYNFPQPGVVTGVGTAGVAAACTTNIISAAGCWNETYFWVKVKDTDNPLWHVKFDMTHTPGRQALEIEFERWMEIFEQHINKE